MFTFFNIFNKFINKYEWKQNLILTDAISGSIGPACMPPIQPSIQAAIVVIAVFIPATRHGLASLSAGREIRIWASDMACRVNVSAGLAWRPKLPDFDAARCPKWFWLNCKLTHSTLHLKKYLLKRYLKLELKTIFFNFSITQFCI